MLERFDAPTIKVLETLLFWIFLPILTFGAGTSAGAAWADRQWSVFIIYAAGIIGTLLLTAALTP